MNMVEEPQKIFSQLKSQTPNYRSSPPPPQYFKLQIGLPWFDCKDVPEQHFQVSVKNLDAYFIVQPFSKR